MASIYCQLYGMQAGKLCLLLCDQHSHTHVESCQCNRPLLSVLIMKLQELKKGCLFASFLLQSVILQWLTLYIQTYVVRLHAN